MASTNKTTTLELSQFVGTDVPGWLTDYNSDMSKIDAFAAKANSDISGAVQTANGANTTAQAASTAANSASSVAQNALNKANQNSLWEDAALSNIYSAMTGNVKVKINKSMNLIDINASWSGSQNLTSQTKLFKIEGFTKAKSFFGACQVAISGQTYPVPANLYIGADGVAILGLPTASQQVTSITTDLCACML